MGTLGLKLPRASMPWLAVGGCLTLVMVWCGVMGPRLDREPLADAANGVAAPDVDSTSSGAEPRRDTGPNRDAASEGARRLWTASVALLLASLLGLYLTGAVCLVESLLPERSDPRRAAALGGVAVALVTGAGLLGLSPLRALFPPSAPLTALVGRVNRERAPAEPAAAAPCEGESVAAAGTTAAGRRLVRVDVVVEQQRWCDLALWLGAWLAAAASAAIGMAAISSKDQAPELARCLGRQKAVLAAGTLVLAVGVLEYHYLTQWLLSTVPVQPQAPLAHLAVSLVGQRGVNYSVLLAAIYLPVAAMLGSMDTSDPDAKAWAGVVVRLLALVAPLLTGSVSGLLPWWK